MIRLFVATLSLLLLAACAAGTEEALDRARFALDKGDYDVAITQAKSVLTADSKNSEAAMLLSTAYAGKAGIVLTSIAGDIIDTVGVGGDNDDFQKMRTALKSILKKTDSLDSLHSAITTLTADLTSIPKSGDPDFKSYSFQVGFLQTLEVFALPVLKVLPDEATVNDGYDPSLLSAAHRTITEADFIAADNYLSDAGLGSGDLVKTLRQNFCTLKNIVLGDVSGEAFTLSQLRDLMRCQFDNDKTNPNTAFDAVTGCALFDFSACSGAGDTAL